jgi:hypothetical protein
VGKLVAVIKKYKGMKKQLFFTIMGSVMRCKTEKRTLNNRLKHTIIISEFTLQLT